MEPVDLSAYKSLFLQTSQEYIDKLEASIQLLSQTLSDEKAIEDAYISAHSLGSQTEAMGYPTTSSLCRVIEAYLRLVKEDKKTISEDTLPLLSDAVSKVKGSLAGISEQDTETDLSEQTGALMKVLGV